MEHSMKILIAVPTYENIYPDTFQSIWNLDRCGHDCIFEFVRGYDVATARSKIGKRAIELDADYVLMVDNDIVLPKDALKHLLDDVRDVQFGAYAYRDKSGNPFDGRIILFKDIPQGYTQFYDSYELDELQAQGQYKVKIRGGGMGCALVKTDVFRQMRYPYFYWVHSESADRETSEDIYFCDQCRGHNIPIYTDTRVRCGHIIRYIQTV